MAIVMVGLFIQSICEIEKDKPEILANLQGGSWQSLPMI